MATVTTIGHVDNAIRFASLVGKLHIGLGYSGKGKASESEDTVQLENLIGLKRPGKVSLAYLYKGTDSDNSVITYNHKKYKLCTQSEAFEKDARFVYISALIKSDDFENFTYDQVALYNGSTFKTGVTGDAIKPDNITKLGQFIAYENRTPIKKQAGVNIEEQMLFEA